MSEKLKVWTYGELLDFSSEFCKNKNWEGLEEFLQKKFIVLDDLKKLIDEEIEWFKNKNDCNCDDCTEIIVLNHLKSKLFGEK